jgi:hypothetical protein
MASGTLIGSEALTLSGQAVLLSRMVEARAIWHSQWSDGAEALSIISRDGQVSSECLGAPPYTVRACGIP